MSGISEDEKARIRGKSIKRGIDEGLEEGLKKPCPAIRTIAEEIMKAFEFCETCRKRAACLSISKNEPGSVRKEGHGCHDCARFDYPCCPCDKTPLPIPLGCLSWLPINEEA